MIDNILQLIEARPFVPFTVVTSGGNRYPVLSPDHLSVSPRRGRITIYFDDDSAVWVTALHIASLEGQTPQVV